MKQIRVSTYATQEGVSVQTIYKWIEQGKVKSVKIDDVIFIEIDDAK